MKEPGGRLEKLEGDQKTGTCGSKRRQSERRVKQLGARLRWALLAGCGKHFSALQDEEGIWPSL